MKIFKSAKILALALALSFSLSACAPTVNLEVAPLANDPSCAEVIVRLPDTVADQDKRASNAQSTAAWGNPAAVILRCGLEPLPASTLTCVTAGDIDWLVDDSAAPSYRFITFGRSPATEVVVDSTVVAGVNALEELAGAVQNIESTKLCLE